jgi:hypothetical protein
MKLPSGPILALGLLASNVANAEEPSYSTSWDAEACAFALKADRLELVEAGLADVNSSYGKNSDQKTTGFFSLTDTETGQKISAYDNIDTTRVGNYTLTDTITNGIYLTHSFSTTLENQGFLFLTNTFLAQPNGTLYAYSSFLDLTSYNQDGHGLSPLHHKTSISGYDARDYRDNRGMAPYSPDTDKRYRSQRGLLVDVPKDELLRGGYAPETYNLKVVEAAQTTFMEGLTSFTQACEEQRAFIKAQMPEESK